MADPLTLLAIGGLAFGGAEVAKTLIGSGSSSAQPTAIAPPTAAAPAVQSPTGSSSDLKSANGPSFLSAAAAPQQQNIGGKSLLGQ